MVIAGAVAVLVGLAGLVWSMTARAGVAGCWPKRFLLCGVAGAVVQAIGFVLLGQWTTAGLVAFLGVVMFGRWESHRQAAGHRIWLQPWLDRTVVRRIPVSRRYVDRAFTARGDRGLTLTTLRTEYAAAILEDATRDPQLDDILDVLGTELLEKVLQVEANTDATATSRLITRYMILTGIANGVLANATDPGRSIGPRPYRGYSQPMLTIAAACRLGNSDELKAIHQPG